MTCLHLRNLGHCFYRWPRKAIGFWVPTKLFELTNAGINMDDERTVHSYLSSTQDNTKDDEPASHPPAHKHKRKKKAVHQSQINPSDSDSEGESPNNDSDNDGKESVWQAGMKPLALVLCSSRAELVGFYHPAFLPQVRNQNELYSLLLRLLQKMPSRNGGLRDFHGAIGICIIPNKTRTTMLR